jgi:hypothetical protein
MQHTKLNLYAASLMLCAGLTLNSSAAETTDLAESPERPPYEPWTVGAEAGTTGLGGFVSWRFYDYLGVRAGFDYLQWTADNVTIQNLKYNAKVRLMSEPLTLDIYPWKKHSFHVSVGMLFNQNELTGDSNGNQQLDQEGNLGGIVSLHLKIQQQPVNPYLSIGGNFLYFDKAHHWALGGELGVAYTGSATVSLTGPNIGPLFAPVVNNEQDKIQHWADQLKWMPVIKLMVTYSF